MEQTAEFIDYRDNTVKYYKLNDLWYCEVKNKTFTDKNLFNAIEKAIQSMEKTL